MTANPSLRPMQMSKSTSNFLKDTMMGAQINFPQYSNQPSSPLVNQVVDDVSELGLFESSREFKGLKRSLKNTLDDRVKKGKLERDRIIQFYPESTLTIQQ